MTFFSLFTLVLASGFPNHAKAYEQAREKNNGFLDSLTAGSLIQQLYLSSNQALLSAKLAADKSTNSRLKVLGADAVKKQIAMNEALRSLAKAKRINLPMSTPEGGQSPDGRIDSAPENLRDTTRNQNSGGAATVPSGKIPQTNAPSEVAVSTEINRLKNINNSEFDKAYQQSATSNHNRLLDLLEEAGRSTDTEIRTFSKKYLTAAKQGLKRLTNLSL